MITFTIEKHHVEAGVAGDCAACPATLALREQYPGEEWLVNPTFVTTKTRMYTVPESLCNWIFQFDCGNTPKFPQTFTLGKLS